MSTNILTLVDRTEYGYKNSNALRSVINLHTFVRNSVSSRGKGGMRQRCTECGFAYPCPTIEAITKELSSE